MEINIKLKLLQDKFNNSLQNTNPHSNPESTLKNQSGKENQHISNNYQNISPHIHDQDEPELQIYNLKSFRNQVEDSTIYNQNTPKEVMTHRYSKSKQIRKTTKGKNISQFQPKINQQKKKKQPVISNFTSPNSSYLFKKTACMKSNRKQNIDKSKTHQANHSFTYKFQGMDGKKVLKQFSEYLTDTQKIEIINEKQIYYIGDKNKLIINEDDVEGNYVWRKHDHIGFRYELLEKLGSGSFGQVIKALDHKSKEFIAIKIIKSKKQHLQLALNQINILMVIKEKDIASEKNCVRLKNFLVFRNHMCLIFQLLNISLYDLIKINDFEGIKMDFIRRFAIQILNALAFLKKNKIIHSDIKPENILLKSKTKTGNNHYIQVLNQLILVRVCLLIKLIMIIFNLDIIELLKQYQESLIVIQLTCGVQVVFQQNYIQECHYFQVIINKNNQVQFFKLLESLLNNIYNQNCKKYLNFFYSNFTPKIIKMQDGKVLLPETKPLSKKIFDKEFLDFLLKIFVWDDQQRLNPLQALKHPWILQGLPKQIKRQHLYFIKQELKNQYPHAKKKKQINQENLKQNSKKKTMKQNQRNSELYFQRKQLQKHRRRRSDGVY